MLTLHGTLRQALRTGGGQRKDGTTVPVRHVLQVEAYDGPRLKLVDLTVPDSEPWEQATGQEVAIPVRAFVIDGRLMFSMVPPGRG